MKKPYSRYNIVLCILCSLFFVVERLLSYLIDVLKDSDISVFSYIKGFLLQLYIPLVFAFPVVAFVLSIVGYVKQRKINIKSKLAVVNIVLSSICFAYWVYLVVGLFVATLAVLNIFGDILRFFGII